MIALSLPQDPEPEPTQDEQVLQCLSRAEALRDSVTNDHESLVGVVSGVLCLALGFEQHHADFVGKAAKLHDIGKFALPSDLLHKPGRLSREEWSMVKTHTSIGHGILRIEGSPFLNLSAMLALCHHEHHDGSGYPRGLVGDEIPFEARIVAVADTYEALRADRAYKRGVGHEAAVATILEGDERSRPAQFDSIVLEALERCATMVAEAYEENRAAIGRDRSAAND